jgi:hypothetical protein
MPQLYMVNLPHNCTESVATLKCSSKKEQHLKEGRERNKQ